jgi:hypothetical protein
MQFPLTSITVSTFATTLIETHIFSLALGSDQVYTPVQSFLSDRVISFHGIGILHGKQGK